MNANAKRVTLLCAGKPKRKLVVTEQPFPEIGDTIRVSDNGTTLKYLVVASEDTQVILNIPFPRKREDAEVSA